MEILIEVIIYFLLILGLITICVTIFEKIRFIDPVMLKCNCSNLYIRKEKKGNIDLTLSIKGTSKKEKDKLINALSTGSYSDIYDVVDTFVINDTT